MTHINLATWNLQNPSYERAARQVSWLMSQNYDIMVLTEVKLSQGGQLLCRELNANGYAMFFNECNRDEYHTIIATKVLGCTPFVPTVAPFLPSRTTIVRFNLERSFLLLGVYVPSRGNAKRRNKDKRLYQSHIADLVDTLVGDGTPLIVGGDLNIIDRDHVPRYKVFGEWEYAFYDRLLQSGLYDSFRTFHPKAEAYSWFGRKGTGYRFDYFFIPKILLQRIVKASYIQTVREQGLSDHAAFELSIKAL